MMDMGGTSNLSPAILADVYIVCNNTGECFGGMYKIEWVESI
jgi:hypothetical protein